VVQFHKMKKQSKLVSAFALIALLSQAFVGLAFAQEFPQAPNEVKNVVATAGNRQITLSWDEANDQDGVVNEYKVYYGKTTVQTAEDSYEDEIIVGKVTNYVVDGLLSGTEYFFAITAIDDEQMESVTYSVEVSATPVAPAGSKMKLLSVTQNWDNEVQLAMSEKVFFAGSPLSAFQIFDKITGGVIVIQEVQVLEDQVVLITGGDLVSGTAYQIVATTEVQNIDGQSIAEGSMDRVEFIATRFAEEPKDPIEEENIEEPQQPSNPNQNSVVEVEEAKNMTIDTSLLKSEQLVILNWVIAEEPNLSDQILYTRRGLEDWDSGYSLGSDISELELEVDLDENYEILLSTIDKDGNESEGTTLSFSTSLSATGPGTIGTVVALLVIFIIGLVFFKKRHAY
jgi:hypothetical protein